MASHNRGIGRSNQHHDAKTVEKVRALRATGLSLSEVGKRLGVSKGVIAGIVDRDTFPARPRADRITTS